MISPAIDPDKRELTFSCLRARQPIGDIFIASLPFEDLIKITYFDVRRVLQSDRDFEEFLGIQRPLEPKRVADLSDYVNYIDASFPTSIIVAIDSEYASFDAEDNSLTVRNYREGETEPSIAIRNVGAFLTANTVSQGYARLQERLLNYLFPFLLAQMLLTKRRFFRSSIWSRPKSEKALCMTSLSLLELGVHKKFVTMHR